MAANPLVGLPPHVCERVLQRMDASDFAALACVSKASATMVRTSGALASRRWLVLRFMREPGAEGKTALDHVLHRIMEEESSDGLAAVHMVCKDLHLAAYPHLRLKFTLTRTLQLGQVSLDTRVGELPNVPPHPRVSFRRPAADADE